MPQLDVVQQAVWADRQIRIGYCSAGTSGAREHVLDPWGLVVKAGVWYLIAARHERRRLYRVDRIQTAEVLDVPARRPPDLDLEALWKRMRSDVEHPRDTVRVVLRVRPDAVDTVLLVLSRLRVDGVKDQPAGAPPPGPADSPGWVRLDLQFRGLDAAHGVLAGFGATVEVVEPQQLRESLTTAAAEVLTLYTRVSRPASDASNQCRDASEGS